MPKVTSETNNPNEEMITLTLSTSEVETLRLALKETRRSGFKYDSKTYLKFVDSDMNLLNKLNNL